MRAVKLCDDNKREAMFNDITGWLELPEVDYVIAKWHLFFPEGAIRDVFARIMLDTPPNKLRKHGWENLLKSIERNMIIPPNLTPDQRNEFIEIQGNLLCKGFKEKEWDNIRVETGMKKYKTVD